MSILQKTAKAILNKYSQALPLGTSEPVKMTIDQVKELAEGWYKQMPQTQSQYTTAKDALAYLLNKTYLPKAFNNNSIYWAVDDVKNYHQNIVSPEEFRSKLLILWKAKKNKG